MSATKRLIGWFCPACRKWVVAEVPKDGEIPRCATCGELRQATPRRRPAVGAPRAGSPADH
jgi:ribosomal protein L34E